VAADRCPGNVLLHHAQDGWLARVRIPGGRLSAEQLLALNRAASIGNGLVELTSRANLQLRGLPDGGAERLVAIIEPAGLFPSAAHDRARNVIASPLAGRHPRSRSSTDAVVEEIDRRIRDEPALAELPGRFLFAVDDGTGIALDHAADVALVARSAALYSLAIAGRLTADPIAAADAPHAAVQAAAAFLAERAERGVAVWRIADLRDGPAALARRLGVRLAGGLERVPATLSPGATEQPDGRVALTALAPLGRLDGADLVRLAELAPEVRIGTGRTVTVLDVEPLAVPTVRAGLASVGLVLEAGSGWVGLTACAGIGRCPKARLDVVGAAGVRARARRPGAAAEHWAGCERRCGERGGQPVAVAGLPAGVVVRRPGSGERLVETLDDALALLTG
jgi:precorrin-3B synthase